MQGIEQIARQNAAIVAMKQAETTGVNQYVVRGVDGKLEITDEAPVNMDQLYMATPQSREV